MNSEQEYSALKTEQIERIKQRDSFLNINIAALFVNASLAFTSAGRPQAWLVAPWICSILGWTYLANDDKISAIAIHMREIIRTGKAPAWESTSKGLLPRSIRRVGDAATFVLAFIAPTPIALYLYASTRPTSDNAALGLAAGIVEVLAATALTAAYGLSMARRYSVANKP